MIRKLITLVAACGLTLGGLTYLKAKEPGKTAPARCIHIT